MTGSGVGPPGPADAGLGGQRNAQLFTVQRLTDGRTGWRIAGEIDLDAGAHFADLVATMTGEKGGADGAIHLDLAELVFIAPDDTQALIGAAQRLHDTSSVHLLVHDPPYSLRRVADILLGTLDIGEGGTLVLPP